MSVIHTYKTWPSFFGAILNGTKTFEVRKDDRDPAPQVGDWLELREYEPGFERYTDRLVRLEISYVLRDSEHFPFPGYIVIGFKNPNIAAEKALREKAEQALQDKSEWAKKMRQSYEDELAALAESERALRQALEQVRRDHVGVEGCLPMTIRLVRETLSRPASRHAKIAEVKEAVVELADRFRRAPTDATVAVDALLFWKQAFNETLARYREIREAK